MWYWQKNRQWNRTERSEIEPLKYSRLIFDKGEQATATRMSFHRWVNNWTVVHLDNKKLFIAKRNELPSNEKTGRDLKHLFPNESSQSEKATFCMLLIIWHSGESKTMEAIRISVVVRGKVARRDERQST